MFTDASIILIHNIYYLHPSINYITLRTEKLKIKRCSKMSSKRRTILAIIPAIILVICVYSAIAQLTYTARIKSTGQISTKVWAKSGSAEDIQVAVDAVAAMGGGTVYIPEGDFEFRISVNKVAANNIPAGVIIPGGVNIIGAGFNKTILRVVEVPSNDNCMFAVEGYNKSIRISGISFIGYKFTMEGQPWTWAIDMMGAKDFRIDHCYFEDFSGAAITCTNHHVSGANRGVIDHCIFDNPYVDNPEVEGEKVWPYGIEIGGPGYESSWHPITYYLGQYDGKENIIYIENCNFTRCRHCTAGSTIGGGWYVIRHCHISMPAYQGEIDVHESYASSPYVGGRGLEAYYNTLIWDTTEIFGSPYIFLIRGGGGVIFNNTIVYTEQQGNYAIYAAKRGANPLCFVKDLWIWNNTLIGTSNLLQVVDEGYGLLRENVDYFLRAPNQQQDGFTYIPYPYPHPLTIG